jgi:hypothetical protein
MASETLYVARDGANAEQIQETLDAILAEIASDESELAAEARRAGLAPGETLTITVEETAPGFIPLAALALVFVKAAGTGAGGYAARRLWEDVIRPEVRRRRGANAVGRDVEPPE